MKDTRIYLSGRYHYVEQPSNEERFTIYKLAFYHSGKPERVAGANDLKTAVIQYDNTRTNMDDIYYAFKEAYADKIKMIPYDKEEQPHLYQECENELYDQYINELPAEEHFNIISDYCMMTYVDWNEIEEEEEED